MSKRGLISKYKLLLEDHTKKHMALAKVLVSDLDNGFQKSATYTRCRIEGQDDCIEVLDLIIKDLGEL